MPHRAWAAIRALALSHRAIPSTGCKPCCWSLAPIHDPADGSAPRDLLAGHQPGGVPLPCGHCCGCMSFCHAVGSRHTTASTPFSAWSRLWLRAVADSCGEELAASSLSDSASESDSPFVFLSSMNGGALLFRVTVGVVLSTTHERQRPTTTTGGMGASRRPRVTIDGRGTARSRKPRNEGTQRRFRGVSSTSECQIAYSRPDACGLPLFRVWAQKNYRGW